MKLSALFKVCKKHKTIDIITGKNDRQWLLVGSYSLYPMDGMPHIDKESLLTMMDVPEDEQGKWRILEIELSEYMTQFAQDNTEGDAVAQRTKTSIVLEDKEYQPFYTRYGMALVDVDMLAPLSDTAKVHEFFAREINGNPVLLVKTGFRLIAAIFRVKINDKEIADELKDVADHICFNDLKAKEEERQHDGEQLKL